MTTLYNYNDEPIKGQAFTFEIALISQADTNIFQTSVTLAAGDVKVGNDGTSVLSNIATLPTELGSAGVLRVALNSTEMNHDRVFVKCTDAAGSEWQDALANIFTKTSVVVSDFDETTNNVNLNSTALANVNAQADTALSDIHLDHLFAADYDPASKPGTATALLNELIGNDGGVSQFTANALELAPGGGASVSLTSTSRAAVADAVWDETMADHTTGGTTGATLNSAAGAGTGANTEVITVDDGTNPLDGVEVWISTDAGGSNVVASGYTDTNGQVTVYLDDGTYYVWKQLSGYNFTNPQTMTSPS